MFIPRGPGLGLPIFCWTPASQTAADLLGALCAASNWPIGFADLQQLLGKCRRLAARPPTSAASYNIFLLGPFVAVSNFALTFKIEIIPFADRLIIQLVGELNAECLPELERQIGSGGLSIYLDLDEVTLVDVDVVRFLIGCEARGIQLRGCSRYIREWIRREQESE